MVATSRRRTVILAMAAASGATLGLLTQALALSSAFFVAGGLYGTSGAAVSAKFGAPMVAGTFSCASYGCLYGATNHVDWDVLGLAVNILSLAAVVALLGLPGRARFPAWGVAFGAFVAGIVFLATGLGPSVAQAPVPVTESLQIWAAALLATGAGAGGVWALQLWVNRRRSGRVKP
jgi:hypothetical protein